MATNVPIENGANVNCFVPNCCNKKTLDGNPIHFFRVPQGNDGLRWKVAVNSNRSQHAQKIGILKRIIPSSTLYCCELHFNIETDCIIAVDANGTAEFSIKREVCPSIKPSRSKLLWQVLAGNNAEQSKMDYDDSDNNSLLVADTKVVAPNHFVSLVDISTLVRSRGSNLSSQDQVKFKPMSVEPMKRKVANGSAGCSTNPIIRPSYSKSLRKVVLVNKTEQSPDEYCGDFANDLLQAVDSTGEAEPNKECISLVDLATSLCRNFSDNHLLPQDQTYQLNELDGETEIKFTPMMPLTMELMKRKALYYLGLEQSLFNRLLAIINTTSLMIDVSVEMKIMLSLRKQRLNEEFEVLGDLFDIDSTTAEQYHNESKNLISSLHRSLATQNLSAVSNDVKNPAWTDGHQSDDDQSSSDSEVMKSKYKGQAASDSDVCTDDFSDPDSTDDFEEPDDDEESYSSDSRANSDNFKRETVECPLCERRVFRLEYHMDSKHLNQLNLNKTTCGLCFEQFGTIKLLRDHKAQIHNGAVGMCDVCGKMFNIMARLKDHVLDVHSKCRRYLCDICGAGYFSRAKLKAHTQSKHSLVPRHACNLCDKKYNNGATLEAHIRSVHTKERPYPCRFECGKSFCRSGARYTHEQMHQFKYFCEICSKEFSFRQNLQTHCKNIHGKIVLDTEKFKIEIKQ